MSSSFDLRRSFDSDAFQAGLGYLSKGIVQSKILAPFRPLEIVASGGFVSVMYLHNRSSTQDLDYFLNMKSFGDQYHIVRDEMNRIIKTVARQLQYDDRWCSDEVGVFLTLLKDPETLFNRSKHQSVVLYSDPNLVVYAVLWEWVLVRKLKRLQMEGQIQRNQDWNDCVIITKLLYDQMGGPLSMTVLKQFDDTEREPPVLPKTIADLRRLVICFYKIDPFPPGT